MIRDGQYDLVKSTFLERLIELVEDKTPNVRLWVAQCLLLISGKFLDEFLGSELIGVYRPTIDRYSSQFLHSENIGVWGWWWSKTQRVLGWQTFRDYIIIVL